MKKVSRLVRHGKLVYVPRLNLFTIHYKGKQRAEVKLKYKVGYQKTSK